MNKEVNVIVGVILLVVGAVLAWQSYLTVTQCNSAGGAIATAISTFFGGQRATTCSNAQIFEVGSIIVAIVGLIVALFALCGKGKN